MPMKWLDFTDKDFNLGKVEEAAEDMTIIYSDS